jgi:hypothetical protein
LRFQLPKKDRDDMNITIMRQTVLAIALTAVSVTAFAGDTNMNDMLLLDSLGRVVRVPTNAVPSELQPSSDVGLERQIPNPTAGASARTRMDSSFFQPRHRRSCLTLPVRMINRGLPGRNNDRNDHISGITVGPGHDSRPGLSDSRRCPDFNVFFMWA